MGQPWDKHGANMVRPGGRTHPPYPPYRSRPKSAASLGVGRTGDYNLEGGHSRRYLDRAEETVSRSVSRDVLSHLRRVSKNPARGSHKSFRGRKPERETSVPLGLRSVVTRLQPEAASVVRMH
jgi:hypothetical protein